MRLATKDIDLGQREMILDWNMQAEDVFDPHDKWRLRFRLQPTGAEIESAGIQDYYSTGENTVLIKCIYLYNTRFIDAEEYISTYERKYNISYGTYGDFPPGGWESTGSLLYPAIHEASTVYQRDSLAGVVGLPGSAGKLETMDKVRGRIMFETHDDKEELPNKTLSKMEQEQKIIYDEIAIKSGSTSFTLRAVVPPGFSAKLSEVGAYYPGLWSCSFTNTVVLPLYVVTSQGPYNGQGYYFDWDFSNYRLIHRCAGSQAGLFTVGSKWNFDYVLRSAFDEGVFQPGYAINLYRSTIGRILSDAWDYIGSFIPLSSARGSSTNTGNANPGPIDPY
jgi:hypothetical protein